MTKAQAATAMEDLVNADLSAVYDKLGDDNYRITVVEKEGIGVNVVKNFADARGLTAKCRVIELT